jgi:hypothetical protein
LALLAPTEITPAYSALEQTVSAAVGTDAETAPLVQRLATHRDRVYMAIMALESEKFELQSRRDYMRQQLEAVDEGFAVHIRDIEATLQMYEAGLNSLDPTGI